MVPEIKYDTTDKVNRVCWGNDIHRLFAHRKILKEHSNSIPSRNMQRKSIKEKWVRYLRTDLLSQASLLKEPFPFSNQRKTYFQLSSQKKIRRFLFFEQWKFCCWKSIFSTGMTFLRMIKYVIIMFEPTSEIIKLTAKSYPQWTLLRWNIKVRCQSAWYYLLSI